MSPNAQGRSFQSKKPANAMRLTQLIEVNFFLNGQEENTTPEVSSAPKVGSHLRRCAI